jgi:hypothetical protein
MNIAVLTVSNEEECSDADHNSQDALDDKDPTPSRCIHAIAHRDK